MPSFSSESKRRSCVRKRCVFCAAKRLGKVVRRFVETIPRADSILLGCGRHIEEALFDVPFDERCQCQQQDPLIIVVPSPHDEFQQFF